MYLTNLNVAHPSRHIFSLIATPGILTITTDFGTKDGYVAAMKGVILSINPAVQIVDISNHITPQDVMEGAFVLRNAALTFPEGTVHLAVVDPGVGTPRKPIAVKHNNQFFVGPDNGLFTLLLSGSKPEAAVELTRSRFWRSEAPSPTFHWRDIFAPVAAHLSTGLALNAAGVPLNQLKSLHWALPITDERGVQGWVVHVDRFGNCITNITKTQFLANHRDRLFKCYAGNAIIDTLSTTYGNVDIGDATLLLNSNDFLEIAIHRGSAAQMLDIRKGTPVNLVFSDERG